jgi:hypothetical protein
VKEEKKLMKGDKAQKKLHLGQGPESGREL